jgi:hypothetical protein
LRASVRPPAARNAVLPIFSGVIARCHEPQMRNLLRSDTPTYVVERKGSQRVLSMSGLGQARLALAQARYAAFKEFARGKSRGKTGRRGEKHTSGRVLASASRIRVWGGCLRRIVQLNPIYEV